MLKKAWKVALIVWVTCGVAAWGHAIAPRDTALQMAVGLPFMVIIWPYYIYDQINPQPLRQLVQPSAKEE